MFGAPSASSLPPLVALLPELPPAPWLPLSVALAAEAAVVVALAVSVAFPARRIWPPGGISWRFWYYWGGVGATVASLSVVAYADAGSFVLAALVWRWLGALSAATGLAIAALAGTRLRPHESVGLAGELRTGGPYRYSRNPQLVGFAVAAVGVVVFANSLWLVVGAAPAALWLALLPRAEEPWLREQFGRAYEQYRRRVPRFVGRRTVGRLWSDLRR